MLRPPVPCKRDFPHTSPALILTPLNPAAALAAHSAFEWLAVAVGVQWYRRSIRGSTPTIRAKQRLIVALGAIAGGVIGSKIAFFLYDPHALRSLTFSFGALIGGQSVVGGLLGGLSGVEIAKRIAGVHASTGDAFVGPILLGIVIGRCGCFLAGLNDATYGKPTTLPWGVDFGDGITRHPTQVYDQVFALILLAALRWARPALSRVPGLQFKLLLSAYLLWRLCIDAFKPMAFVYPGGLSGLQLLCLFGLILYLPFVFRDLLRWSRA